MRTLLCQSSLELVFTTVALLGITLVGLAQERDREKIPDKYKWNLADIYPTEAAWRAAKDRIAAEVPALGQYRGKLMSSARTLADALETMSRLDKEIARLFVYAEHAGGPGHARQHASGHAAGNDPARDRVQLGGGVHRAGDPARRQGDARDLHRGGSAAEGLPDVPR